MAAVNSVLAPPSVLARDLAETWPPGTHYVTIATLDDFRDLLGTADVAARRQRSAVFYRGIEARQRLPQGMHDRCEEYAFAAGNPSARDLEGLARHLPIHCKLIRLHSCRIHAGQVWDLTVEHEGHWPELDHLEERYVLLHVDHLLLERNARIVVRGNVLAVECGTLERVSPEPCAEPVSDELYDFGVLPTPFSVDRMTNTNTGAHGENGLVGAHGANGAAARVEGSLLGPSLVSPGTAVDSDGTDGGDGGHGTDGRRGRNGGMCRLADIRIGRLIGFENNPLRLFAQAGAGGPGGNGGDGGDAGAGGNGADGVDAINGFIPAGRGGDGGNGGDGGDGGDGGNGGIASNVFLQLRPRDCARVQLLSLPSAGGEGGCGGGGGKGGTGGRGGRSVLTADEHSARDGMHGQTGRDGRSGSAGKPRPGANIFVIPASDEG